MDREQFVQDFLQEIRNLSLGSIKKDSGITEFCFHENLSAGISFEAFEEPATGEGYIFNLFLRNEYINLPSIFRKDGESFTEIDTGKRIEDVITEEIKKLKIKRKNDYETSCCSC